MSLPLGEYSLKFKFIHAADVHLDGECGIATGGSVDMPTDLKSMLSNYTRRAFSRLVDLCLAEQVDFLLLAGDVFDRPDRSLSAQMFVKREMERLNSGKVDVYMCFGNHDYVNADFPKVIYPPNVHIFGSEKVEDFAVITGEEHIADVFGISFASREVRNNLSLSFPRMGGNVRERKFNIGVLHANVGGASGYQNYCPCALGDLATSDIDYWALGHVHDRRILRKSDPAVVYPGNIQGRGFHEEGAKGCYLVSVEDGELVALEFMSTDVVRWKTVKVDIAKLDAAGSDEPNLEELIDKVVECVTSAVKEEDVSCIVNTVLEGKGSFHRLLTDSSATREHVLEEIERRLSRHSVRGNALNGGVKHIWAEELEIHTQRPMDRNALVREGEFMAEFLRVSDEVIERGASHRLVNDVLSSIEGDRDMWRHLKAFGDDEVVEMVKAAQSMGIDLLLSEEE